MKGKYLNTLIALVVLGALWGGITYHNKHKQNSPAIADKDKVDKILLNFSQE